MHPDRDFDRTAELPAAAKDLTQDLGLGAVTKAMAADDKFLSEIANVALLTSLTTPAEILFRQAVLRDCIAREDVARGIYALAVEAIDTERKQFWGGLSRNPGYVLHRSVEVLQMFVGLLKRLLKIAKEAEAGFESAGFRRFFAMLIEELSDEYFAEIAGHLRQLRFRGGILMSAALGDGNKGRDYTLRQPNASERGWLGRLFIAGPPEYTYRLHPRDEAGGRMLAELRDRGINPVAYALARSTDHILSFFTLLRAELAFYVGCLNLRQALESKGQRVAFPRPAAVGERRFSCRGIYDAALQLSMTAKAVGNEVNGEGKEIVVITGANQGGKSTFLRSTGLAFLMMQCGMFVAADEFETGVARRLFTHFKREEDATMRSGKLDEELARMDAIAGQVRAGAVVLFNESFAATNEREGSEIARGIVNALLDCGTRVFFVTHMYDFANGVRESRAERALFLRAERTEDGRRSFRMIEAEPLTTSFAADVYRKIFGAGDDGQSEPVSCPRRLLPPPLFPNGAANERGSAGD